MSYCPECEAAIDAEFEDVGELLSCPECGVELEVISVDPVEFDLAPVDEDDDNDDDDDEFAYDDADEEDEWDDEEDSYEEDEEKDNEY